MSGKCSWGVEKSSRAEKKKEKGPNKQTSNDEFCEQRRTGAHLAEGAAKDTFLLSQQCDH